MYIFVKYSYFSSYLFIIYLYTFIHNLGHKKYKLFEVTKFILVLPTF